MHLLDVNNKKLLPEGRKDYVMYYSNCVGTVNGNYGANNGAYYGNVSIGGAPYFNIGTIIEGDILAHEDEWQPVDIKDVETLFAFAPAGKFDENILEIIFEASEVSYDEFVNYIGINPREIGDYKQTKRQDEILRIDDGKK